MRKILLKLFVKDYQNVNDPIVRSKYGILAGIVGIVSNLVLCSVKIIAGLVSGSISILADGINNLSDAGSSVITFVGFKLSTKPADEDHPFGHERIEYLTGMLVSIVIIIIGASLFTSSISKVFNPSSLEINILIYIILIISIFIKLIQCLFYRGMGKDISSTSLMATAQDSVNDCIATFVVLIGMVVFQIWQVNIDGYMGLVVSIFIVISGIKMLKETMNPLIGIAPTPEDVEFITKKICEYEGVLGVHDMVIHNYGPNKTFVTVHVEVSKDVDIMISHDMIDNIERDFQTNHQIEMVIHMDPVDINNPETLKLKAIVLQIINELDPKISIHDFRVVHGVTHTNILFDMVIPYKYPMSNKDIKQFIKTKIIEYDEKLIPIIQIDQLYSRND